MNIKNKTVAIIGSSKNLEGQEMGGYIDDSFDYVVKFNGSLFMHNNEEYCKDYGSRDDIHFLTNPFIQEMAPDLDNLSQKPYFLFKKKYPQYKRINYEVIKQSFDEVEKQMQKGFAYSGVAVLNYILKCKPNKIHILGMDMYINQPNFYDGDWSDYPNGYIPEKMKELTNRLHADGHLVHSRYWNAVVLKKLLLKNNNVIFDLKLMDNIDYIIQRRKDYE